MRVKESVKEMFRKMITTDAHDEKDFAQLVADGIVLCKLMDDAYGTDGSPLSWSLLSDPLSRFMVLYDFVKSVYSFDLNIDFKGIINRQDDLSLYKLLTLIWGFGVSSKKTQKFFMELSLKLPDEDQQILTPLLQCIVQSDNNCDETLSELLIDPDKSTQSIEDLEKSSISFVELVQSPGVRSKTVQINSMEELHKLRKANSELKEEKDLLLIELEMNEKQLAELRKTLSKPGQVNKNDGDFKDILDENTRLLKEIESLNAAKDAEIEKLKRSVKALEKEKLLFSSVKDDQEKIINSLEKKLDHYADLQISVKLTDNENRRLKIALNGQEERNRALKEQNDSLLDQIKRRKWRSEDDIHTLQISSPTVHEVPCEESFADFKIRELEKELSSMRESWVPKSVLAASQDRHTLLLECVSNLENHNSLLTNERDNALQLSSMYKTRASTLLQKNEKLRSELIEKTKQISQIEKTNESLKGEVDALTAELQTAFNEVSEVTAKYDATSKLLSNLKHMNDELVKMYDKLHEKLRDQTETYTMQVNFLNNKCDALETENCNLRNQCHLDTKAYARPFDMNGGSCGNNSCTKNTCTDSVDSAKDSKSLTRNLSTEDTDDPDMDRLRELQRRNNLTLPHLRSVYPSEYNLQVLPEEVIRCQSGLQLTQWTKPSKKP